MVRNTHPEVADDGCGARQSDPRGLGRRTDTPLEAVPHLYARARAAFLVWSRTSLRERVQLLRRLRLVIVERLDELAEVVAVATGKPLAEVVTTELLPVLDTIAYLEKLGPRTLRRRRMPTPIFLAGKTSYVEYRPRGVVLVISPWNYPFQLSVIPLVTALMAGNVVILKPSEVTPSVGILVEDLFTQAALSDGVIQVAHGDGSLGAALVQGRPDYIFFTGSVHTGKLIQAEAAKHLIPTTLELSGHDAMIVFADARLERAVRGAVWGAFMNCGQTCLAVERIYVERAAYGEFTRRLAAEVARLRWEVGEGGGAETSVRRGVGSDVDVGALTSERQVDIVKEHVRDALAKGATLLVGEQPERWRGRFIPPIVLTDVTGDMLVAQRETFGPVVTVAPFDTEAEAVALANASDYGLGASVWSTDVGRAERVASQLETGSVAINDVIVTIANPHLPFGGVKQSGLGAYHGEAGLKALSHEKAVVVDRLGRGQELYWFPYAGKAPLFADLLRAHFGPRRRWLRFFERVSGAAAPCALRKAKNA